MPSLDAVNEIFPVSPPRAWAEIDLGALKRNLAVAREAFGGDRLMAVVKAGAYGHGLEEIAKALAAEDIAFFGVANVGEARRIRNAGVETRIYLLGATWSEEREEIVARDWTPCISSIDEAEQFNRLAAARGVRLKVHLAVDTGMGRGGFVAENLPEKLALLERMENLEVEGIGSHLPSADEDEEFTLRQFARFHAIIRDLGGDGAVQVAASVQQRGPARLSAGLLQSLAAGADALRSLAASRIPGKTRHGDEPEIAGDAGPHAAGRARGFLRAAVRHHQAHARRDGRHRLRRRLPAACFGKRRGRVDPRPPAADPRAGDHGPDDGGRDRCRAT